MRIVLYTISLIFVMPFASCQQQQNEKVPQVVVESFKAKYPNESIPEFNEDVHGYWEAHFTKKGKKYRADFHPDGSWRETENSIKVKNLPKAIRKAIKDEYGADAITEVEHVMSATKGEFYDVEFKRKGKNHDVEYRKDGTKVGS